MCRMAPPSGVAGHCLPSGVGLAFLALRLRRADLERPFLAPGGRAGATVLATGWSLLVTACLLWPGLGTAVPGASLPAGFEGQRLQFELLVLAPLAAVVAACTVFHVTSRRRA